MSPKDRTIVDGYVAGDPASHRQVDTWIAEVLRGGRLFLGDERDDVAQEVRRRLLLAFRSERFQGDSSLRTYVWKAAQRAALNALRGRRRKPAGSMEDLAFEPAAHGEDPSADVEARERRALLQSLFDALGEDCRRLWGLTVFEELPYRVAAVRLGLTEANVKVKALRCRRRALELYRERLGARGERLGYTG